MRARRSIMGAVWFFVTIAAVVTLAVVGYSCVARFTDNNTLIAVIMLGGILALALVCTVIDVARRRVTVARPVRKILGATDRIAAGDFSVRLEPVHPYGRYDEYDRIMENLNKMAAELSKTAVLSNDFVSNVSHELKTPLFTLQGYILTLLDGGLNDPGINVRYLEKANKNVERLIAIVKDLEDISKLEMKIMNLNREQFDIVALCKDIVDSLSEQAKAYQVTLKVTSELPIDVFADKVRIEQVMTNLLVNSIKYGKPGGMTKVKFVDMFDKVMVEVEDNGIGISKENLPRVFERFFRADKSRSREEGGTGLGLAIVKHIIEAHKEKINVRSELGKGTVFSFTLNKYL